MTIKNLETTSPSSETNYSKSEILDIFAGVGQVEIPTREQVLASQGKTVLHIKERKRPRLIIQRTRKAPSKSYLCNLNPRIAKADNLWHNLWGRERGELLRYCGVKDNTRVQELVNNVMVPEAVINTFINGGI